MQLTAEQIDLIEKTLVLNGLVYQDIKLEVLDHIASEIEVVIKENSLSFEQNFKIVFKKWETELRSMSYGISLGNHFAGPKLAMDKLASASKKEFKWVAICGSLITFIILFFYSLNKSIIFLETLQLIIKTICYIIGSSCILGRIILLKSKTITSYSALFTKRFFFTLFYPFLLFTTFSHRPYFHRNYDIKVISILFAVIFTLFLLSNFKRLIKHFQFEKKLKNS